MSIVGDFYNGGLWRHFSFFVISSWNFVPGIYKKRWHTSWKFQLEITSKKLSPKSLWQTYMKLTVAGSLQPDCSLCFQQFNDKGPFDPDYI